MEVADIVMPRMDGGELGERLRRSHPNVPVLYKSGHTGDELSRRKLLDPSMSVPQKPFLLDELLPQVQGLVVIPETE
jgi:two-component system, cell cycle sensor histidine kinase and response regulator CckA